MKTVLNVLALACMLSLTLIASTANAGGATGKITKLYVLSCPTAANQSECAIGIVALNVPANNAPMCHTVKNATSSEYAFAINTPAGKSMFQLLMHAQVTKAPVTIVGDTTCGAWGDRERPNYIWADYPEN
jgi:hypothetical protein